MIESIVLVVIVIVLLVGIGLLVSSMNSNSEDDEEGEDDEDEDEDDDEGDDEDTGTDELPLKTVGGTQYKAIQNYLLFSTAYFDGPDGSKHTLETCAATAKARGASAFTFRNDDFPNDYGSNECYGYVQIPDGTDTSTIFDPKEVSSTLKMHDGVGGQVAVWTLNPNWFTGCVNRTRDWPYCGAAEPPGGTSKTVIKTVPGLFDGIGNGNRTIFSSDKTLRDVPFTLESCAGEGLKRGAASFTYYGGNTPDGYRPNSCILYKAGTEPIGTPMNLPGIVAGCVDQTKEWPQCVGGDEGVAPNPAPTGTTPTGSIKTVPGVFNGLFNPQANRIYSSYEVIGGTPPFTLDSCISEGVKYRANVFMYYGEYVPYGYPKKSCTLFKNDATAVGTPTLINDVFTGCVDQTKQWPQCAYK